MQRTPVFIIRDHPELDVLWQEFNAKSAGTRTKLDELQRRANVVIDESQTDHQTFWSTFEAKASHLFPQGYTPETHVLQVDDGVLYTFRKDETKSAPEILEHLLGMMSRNGGDDRGVVH